MKKITNEHMVIIVLSAIVVGFIIWGTLLITGFKQEINTSNTEKTQLKEDLEDAEVRAAKKTRMEIIEEQVDQAHVWWKEYKKIYEDSKKIYESNIWYTRCLEVEGELQLKKIKTELKCLPYYINTTWLVSDKHYIELQRFKKENLQKTKEDLGL